MFTIRGVDFDIDILDADVMERLEDAAEKIVNGHFDINVTYESKDELGSLTKSFKNMTYILDSVISDASRLLSEMADGNFDVRTKAEDKYVGNLQSLLLSIRKLNKDLSVTLGQINLSADQVASGSGQVSNGAQALAQGATEQASAVEELSATIADISTNSQSNAKRSEEAMEHSKELRFAGAGERRVHGSDGKGNGEDLRVLH